MTMTITPTITKGDLHLACPCGDLDLSLSEATGDFTHS